MVDTPGPTPTLPMQHGKAFFYKNRSLVRRKAGPQFVPFVVVTCLLRNRVPTIGGNNIFDFLFFQKSYVVSSFSTSPTNSQRGCVLVDPKSTKINNNKNFIICDIDLPTREVSQK